MDKLTSRDRHDFAQAISIVARRWRTRLDERLKPMNMSIARWGALYWLGQAGDAHVHGLQTLVESGPPAAPDDRDRLGEFVPIARSQPVHRNSLIRRVRITVK